MTFDDAWRYQSGRYDHGPLSQTAQPQRLLGGAALAVVALACAWTLYVNLGGGDAGQIELAGTRGDKLDLAAIRGDKLAAAKRALAAVANAELPSAAPSGAEASLFDPRYSLGRSPGTFADNSFASRMAAADANSADVNMAKNTAKNTSKDTSKSAPSPSAIRQALALPSAAQVAHDSAADAASPPLRNAALRNRANTDRVAEAAPSQPTIFERLFGKPSAPALAYASADDGASSGGPAGRYDGQTAVYDISARTVYLPDGTRLEAHSGYGDLLDDPRHADAKDRGVTPPNVYDLTLREAPFHGVRALRLIPVDDAKVFGRTGLLAHSFMLGPNGDSNGCVSFRNYDAFLQAYMNHEIKRLVVVAGG
jgi:type VI secretion system (T6SS) effector TldE1-like protein